MSELSYMDKLLDGVEVEWKELGEIAEVGTGKSNRQDESEDGAYPFYVRSKSILKSNTYQFDEVAIIIPGEGGIGDIFHYVEGKYALHQRAYRIHVINEDVNTKFLYHLMRGSFKKYILAKSVGATSASIRKPMLEKFPIPIPPLNVQAEIVRILDTFTELTEELTEELTARQQQYAYYRDELLTFEEGEVEWKTLNEVCSSISAGGDLPESFIKGQTNPTDEFPYPIYANATGDKGLYGFTDGYKIESEAVTISARGAKVGYHTVRQGKFTPIVRLIALVPNKGFILTRYLN